MAASVRDTNQSVENTNTTSHTVALPASRPAGDLIIIQFGNDGVGGSPRTWSDGFVELASDASSAQVRLSIGAKIATGSEPATITVTTPNSEKSSHTSRSIQDHGVSNVSTDIGRLLATGASTTPDPPELTPAGGSAEYLWLADACHDDSSISFTGNPAGYGGLLEAVNSQNDGVGLRSMTKTATAASENPGNYTISASETWVTATLSIPPAADVPLQASSEASAQVGSSAAPKGLKPTGVQVTNNGDGTADITATVQSPHRRHTLERASAESGPYSPIHVFDAPITSLAYTDSGLTGTSWWYRYCVFDATGLQAQACTAPVGMVGGTLQASSHAFAIARYQQRSIVPEQPQGPETEFSVWSNVEAAGGRRLAFVPVVIDAFVVLSVDGNEQMGLSLPLKKEDGSNWAWSPFLTLRNVIRAETQFGEVFEFRISSIQDNRGGGPAQVAVSCEPILMDLGSILVGKEDNVGGGVTYNLGVNSASPWQVVDTFAIRPLADAGLGYIKRGKTKAGDPLTFGFQHETPLGIADSVRQALTTEWQLRRVGGQRWELDIAEIQNDRVLSTARIGRNVTGITRTFGVEELATELFPLGRQEPGTVDPGNISDNEWKVVSVNALTLEIADPSGGDPPIGFANQLDGLYVRHEGSVVDFVASCDHEAQTVTLDTTIGNIGVGHRITFARDMNGGHLEFLKNPAAVDALGAVVGIMPLPTLPTHKNYVPDRWQPENLTTTVQPNQSSEVGSFVGNYTGAQVLTISGLQPNTTYPAGTLINQHANNATQYGVVQSPVTTDGTGQGVFTTGGSHTASDGDSAVVLVDSQMLWEPWTANAAVNDPAIGVTDRTEALVLNGTVSGATTSKQAVTVTFDPLLAGTVVPVGARLKVAGEPDSTNAVQILNRSVIGASNTFVLHEEKSYADAAAVEILIPQLTALPGFDTFLTFPSGVNQQWDDPTLKLRVRHDPSRPELWLAMGYSLFHGVDNTGVSLVQPAARFRESGSITDVHIEAKAPDQAGLAKGLIQNLSVRANMVTTEDIDGYLQLEVPDYSAAGYPTPTIRWVALWRGTNGQVQFPKYPFANVLWQRCQDRLLKGTPVQYGIDWLTLAELADFDPAKERPDKGVTAPVEDEVLGIDVRPRIVRCRLDLLDPTKDSVVLETMPIEASTALVPARYTVVRPSDVTNEITGTRVRPAAEETGTLRLTEQNPNSSVETEDNDATENTALFGRFGTGNFNILL